MKISCKFYSFNKINWVLKIISSIYHLFYILKLTKLKFNMNNDKFITQFEGISKK